MLADNELDGCALDILRTKRSNASPDSQPPVIGSGGTSVRRTIRIAQGIPQDTAKKSVKAIKDQGFKKVQTSIQGEEIRVTAPSKDELQEVISFLRGGDFELELKFGNYRG